MAGHAERNSLGGIITDADLRQLDAAYKPFPSFQEWSNATADSVRWDRYSATLDQLGRSASSEQLKRARKIAVRAAAIDTGAIEGLYDVDRGFTFTVATEAAASETALRNKGEQVRSLIESQMGAYEYVVDFATKAEPITEAAIRILHEQVVASQPTYRVGLPSVFRTNPCRKADTRCCPITFARLTARRTPTHRLT